MRKTKSRDGTLTLSKMMDWRLDIEMSNRDGTCEKGHGRDETDQHISTCSPHTNYCSVKNKGY